MATRRKTTSRVEDSPCLMGREFKLSDQQEHDIERALAHIDSLYQRIGTINSPGRAGQWFKLQLGCRPNEVFAVLFLDIRHQMISFDELSIGSIDSSNVPVREILLRALKYNAAAVILAHNHPSGVCEPSAADRTVTYDLKEALKHINVRVLDHFIVGYGEPVSLAERGWV